jgi:hypothetical protein
MTVSSRPVLGQIACSASAMTSMNANTSHTHNCSLAAGLSPEQWKQQAPNWPTPYTVSAGVSPKTSQSAATSPMTTSNLSEGTLFHSSTTGLSGRVFGDLTMFQVINIGEGQESIRGLGRYVVAALLNARAGRTRMLTETNARNMWNDLLSRGYYEPTAGIRWGASEIIAYIRTTIV